jgi:hypothetical protein
VVIVDPPYAGVAHPTAPVGIVDRFNQLPALSPVRRFGLTARWRSSAHVCIRTGKYAHMLANGSES